MQPIGHQRPQAVTAAVYLLYLIAGAQLLSGALGVPLLDDIRDAYEAAYGGVNGRSAATVAVGVGASLGLILAMGYGLLGFLVGRGSNGARVTTWVFVGMSLCCFSAGAFYRTSPTEPRVTKTDVATRSDLTQTISDAMPAYTVTMFVLAWLSLIAAIVVITLLMLPAAHPFFRRSAPPPYPPHPGHWYPQQHPGHYHRQ